MTVANVQHLGTRMEGRLSRPAPNVLDLARHSRPPRRSAAYPRAEALALIADVEGFERGRYGGAVGWVDADGNGTWAVAIRCAELSADRRTARLFAGGGIVADSDPLAELAETQAKFQAMLGASSARDRRSASSGHTRSTSACTAAFSAAWTYHVGGRSVGTARPRPGGSAAAAVDAVAPRRRRGRGRRPGPRHRCRAACRTVARTARGRAPCLRQEREDAAAVVVDHDDPQVDAARGERR